MSTIRSKKVLVLYFSQTGQLERVVRSVTAPLESAAGLEAHVVRIRPRVPYPFPWPVLGFFDVFPECVYLDPPELQPLPAELTDDYDLIVLGYQPWYLSPSLPTAALLKSEFAAAVMRGKPVVTVIACRNMWLMAQEEVKKLIAANGGYLLDSIVLVDQGSAAASFVTTVRWMLTGRKNPFMGIFPAAGVAEADIARVRQYGERLQEALLAQSGLLTQPVLRDLQPFVIDQANLLAETLGRRSFLIWGWLVRRLGPAGHPARKPLLAFYALFLGTAILTVVPLTALLQIVLGAFPAFRRRMNRWADRFRSPYLP